MGQGVEGAEQLLGLACKHYRPLLELGPGGGQGEGEVDGLQLGVVAQVGDKLLGLGRRAGSLLAERTKGSGPEGDCLLPVLVLGRGARAGVPTGHGRLLQDQVGVGAADAEGGDGGAAGMAVGSHSRASLSSSTSPSDQSTLVEGASR